MLEIVFKFLMVFCWRRRRQHSAQMRPLCAQAAARAHFVRLWQPKLERLFVRLSARWWHERYCVVLAHTHAHARNQFSSGNIWNIFVKLTRKTTNIHDVAYLINRLRWANSRRTALRSGSSTLYRSARAKENSDHIHTKMVAIECLMPEQCQSRALHLCIRF